MAEPILRVSLYFLKRPFNAGYFLALLLNIHSNYSVNSEGVCYRTEIAACLMYMEEEDWRNHLEGSTEGVDEKKSEDIIKGWLRTYAAEADATMSALRKAMESGAVPETHHGKAEYLLRRWKQIKSICESASSALSL